MGTESCAIELKGALEQGGELPPCSWERVGRNSWEIGANYRVFCGLDRCYLADIGYAPQFEFNPMVISFVSFQVIFWALLALVAVAIKRSAIRARKERREMEEKKREEMKAWKEVESSNLQAVRYLDGELWIKFKRDGSVYRYFDAPEQSYRQIVAADSPGKAFRAAVKGLNYEKI